MVENQSQSRVFVLSGDAGMSKTGIMSKLVRSRTDTVMATISPHDDSRKCDPKLVLCSIAYQISLSIPAYRTALESMGLKREEVRQDMNTTALFHKILYQPLGMVENSFSKRQIILIDALTNTIMTVRTIY